MNLPRWAIKAVVVLTIMAFCGCATTQAPLPSRPSERERTILSEADGKAAPEVLLRKEVLRKGQAATMDGILFDTESAKIVLGDLAEYRQVKIKIQIQNEIITAYSEQIRVLREAIVLQAEANQGLREEIESQRRWAFWRNALSVVGIIGGIIAGAFAAK